MACSGVNFTFVFVFLLFSETSQISGKDSFLFNSALLLCSVYLCSTFSFRSRRSVSFIHLCESPDVACVHTCRSCSRRNESHLFQVVRKYLKALIGFVSLIFPQSRVNLEANSVTMHGSRTASCALCCRRSEFGACYFDTIRVKTEYACTVVQCIGKRPCEADCQLVRGIYAQDTRKESPRVTTSTLRLPCLRFFRSFSSVVRQMQGYNSQRRGTARTLPN